MKAQHTPAPWHRDGHNLSSIIHCTKERGHPDAKHITGDYETIARCDGENWDANSRLIAAAPDLLAALQFVLSAHGEQLHEAFDDAHKAITKATGAAS